MTRGLKWSLLLVFIFVSQGFCTKWRKELQLRFWLGMDDNVFETLACSQTDETGSLTLVTTIKGQMNPELLLGFQYLAAFQGYSSHSSENRLIQSALLLCEQALPRHIAAGMEFSGRQKHFPEMERGFIIGEWSPYVRWSFKKTAIHLSAHFSAFNYQRGIYFDYSSKSASLRASWTVQPRWQWHLSGSAGTCAYQRQAYAPGAQEIENGTVFLPLGEDQKDYFYEFAVETDGYGWALFQAAAGYRKRISNHYGYGSVCPFFECTVGKTVFQSFTVSVRTQIQWLKYTDDLRPLLQLRPDSESEECSALVLECSKKLTRAHALGFRYGLYENESPFRNRFYQKRVITLGYSCRF